MATMHIPSVATGRTIVADGKVSLQVETGAGVTHTLDLSYAAAWTLSTMLNNAVLTAERARLELPNPRPTLVGEPA